MSASIQAVVGEFSVQRSQASREEQSDALLREAGAVVAERQRAAGAAAVPLARGPATNAATLRAQGVINAAGPDVDPLFEARTLTAAASFMSVSCDIVRPFKASPRSLSVLAALAVSPRTHNEVWFAGELLKFCECIVQARPNPDFGGSKQDADHVLRNIEGHMPLPPPTTAVEDFVTLCSTPNVDRTAVAAAFRELPHADYKLVPQRTQAWHEIRSRIFVTASQLFNLALLPLVPTGRVTSFPLNRAITLPAHRKGAHEPPIAHLRGNHPPMS